MLTIKTNPIQIINNNKITIIDRDHHKESFDLKPKNEVAVDICKKVLDLLQ